MLRPARMEKIAVVGLRRNREKVISILHDLGAVQIEPLSKETSVLVGNQADGSVSHEVSDELLRIRSIKSALPPVAVSEKRRFSTLPEILEASRSINIDKQVGELVSQREQLLTELENVNNRLDIVEKLSFIRFDLSLLSFSTMASFLGETKNDVFRGLKEELETSVPKAMVYPSMAKESVTLVVIVPNDNLDAFGSIMQKFGLKFERVPQLKGVPEEVKNTLLQTKSQIQLDLDKIKNQLEDLSKKHYSLLTSVEEQLSIEAKKLDALSNLGFTENALVLEGWIPKARLGQLKQLLDRNTEASTFIYELKTSELPPTLMNNPSRLRLFESFVRFYSLPQSEEIDPTAIYSIVFPIFFGLMLGDVGYGLVILAFSAWIIRHVQRGGKTVVPEALRRFGRTIFKPIQWVKLAKAMTIGAVVAIILGFLFNEYFGFGFNQYLFQYLNSAFGTHLPSSGAFLNPISGRGVKVLLLVSGYIGLFLVSFGFVLGAVDAYLEGNARHVVGKIGWLVVAVSISLLGLLLLHHGNVDPVQNSVSAVYVAGLVAGVALVFFGEGSRSLIEFPSVISHIISYTRIVGILLASVVLAEVIDVVFVGTLHSGVAALVFGFVILVFGQLFNIVIGIFEPGIQGARLLYVEFFSKFFAGNGRPFKPFGSKRVYTLAEIDIPSENTN
jgi:V/A-type H+-transporting ATPase subunit I